MKRIKMKLKACPFCGEKPGIKTLKLKHLHHRVECMNPNCPAPPSTRMFLERAVAMENWNKRGKGRQFIRQNR